MPQFGSPFSELANGRTLTDEELVHAGEFLKLLYALAPDEEALYAKGAKEVADIEKAQLQPAA